MKFKLNRTYTTIAIYALCVIAFALVLASICINIEAVGSIVSSFFDKLACLFFGIFFTFCFLPLVRFFEKKVFGKLFERKKKRPTLVAVLSTILVDLLFLGILVITVVGIVPAFIDGYHAFTVNITPEIKNITDKIHASDSTVFVRIYDAFYSFIANLLSPESGSLVNSLAQYGGAFLSSTYDVLVGLILATYFLVSRKYLLTIANKFFTAFLPTKFRITAFAVVKRIYNYFVEFFSFKLISGIILGVLTYLLCLVIGIPYGVVIAVLIFVGVFVPVFGPIVATIASTALIALFASPGARIWQSLTVLLILTALYLLTDLLVEPIFLRKKLRPGPGTVVTIILVCYALFGFGGILFAIPIYTSADVTYREIQARLLARKNLPLSNSYYLNLDELPVTEKTSTENNDSNATAEEVSPVKTDTPPQQPPNTNDEAPKKKKSKKKHKR